MSVDVFDHHAEVLKILAHPKRLEIIHLLRDQELCVGDIYTMIHLPQAALSQHLQRLRDIGLVVTRREGKQIFYRLKDTRIIQASDLLSAALEMITPEPSSGSIQRHSSTGSTEAFVIDPVCGMHLDPRTTRFHLHMDDTMYHFCASGCMEKFKAQSNSMNHQVFSSSIKNPDHRT